MDKKPDGDAAPTLSAALRSMSSSSPPSSGCRDTQSSIHFPFSPATRTGYLHMPKRLQLPFLSCRHAKDRHHDRQVLGDDDDDCWPIDLQQSMPGRRRSHLTSSMRTAPADKPSPALSTDSDEFLPLRASRKIRMSDAELVRRARNASHASRSGRLLRVPSVMWDCKDVSGFALLSRRSGTNGENFEVLTTGEMNCRPCDVEPLLHPQTENDYNAAARGFYGEQFIFGSLVHDVHSRGFGNSSQDSIDIDAPSKHFHLDGDDRVAVKTACFAHSRRFARNEEWCFVEHFQSGVAPLSSSLESFASSGSTSSMSPDEMTGFTVVMSSIPESELNAGKMANGRVVQLHGIIAAYLVEPLPQTVGSRGPRVRVSFHATFVPTHQNTKGYADSQTVQGRLLSIARSLHRLPELVQQRQRQCSQVRPSGLESDFNEEFFAKREAQNSRCVVCTKRLRLRLLSAPTRPSKRCQICWYKACSSCWSKQKVSTFNGHSTTMVVCNRCQENLDNSEYSHVHLTC